MCLGHLTDRAALLPSPFFQVGNPINLANLGPLVNFDPFGQFGQLNHDKMIKSDMINSKPEETRAADLEVSTPFFNPLDGALYLHPKTS